MNPYNSKNHKFSIYTFESNTLTQQALMEILLEKPLVGEDACGAEPKYGVTGRDAGHRDYTENDIQIDDHITFGISSMQKIPSAALVEVYASNSRRQLMKATQTTLLSRKQKREIKEDVIESLLDDTPITYKRTDVTVVFLTDSTGLILVGDTLWKTVEFVEIYLYDIIQEAGLDISMRRHNIQSVTGHKAIDHEPLHICEGVGCEEHDQMQSRDFLTWLWHLCEWGPQPLTDWTLALGPGNIMFAGEGAGAEQVALARGVPSLAREAHNALLAGKKLKRAQLYVARGEEQYRFYFEADKDAFSAVKLPDGEELDPYSAAGERLEFTLTFIELMESLYREYTNVIDDETTRDNMIEWVADRHYEK
jgi:hypothetical protein